MRLGKGEESDTLRKYLFIGHSEISSGGFSVDEYVAILNEQNSVSYRVLKRGVQIIA